LAVPGNGRGLLFSGLSQAPAQARAIKFSRNSKRGDETERVSGTAVGRI
jgi:hypothetical protein